MMNGASRGSQITCGILPLQILQKHVQWFEEVSALDAVIPVVCTHNAIPKMNSASLFRLSMIEDEHINSIP